MNFQHTYPRFGGEHIALYNLLATPEEQEECAKQVRIKSVHNSQNKDVVISVSMFAKAPDPGMDHPAIPGDLEHLHKSITRGERSWIDAYLTPFIDGVREIKSRGLPFAVRVYLAADLETFLLERLVGTGVEVRVMESSSIFQNPGACWRFLAFDDSRIAFSRDCESVFPLYENAGRIQDFIKRSLATVSPKVLRYIWNGEHDEDSFIYRPLSGSGIVVSNPDLRGNVAAALEAWHWFGTAGNKHRTQMLPTKAFHRIRGEVDMFGAQWPKYGGDEQFISQLLYWDMAEAGRLETIIGCDRDHVHATMIDDLAYVLQQNPAARISMQSDPIPSS